MDFHASQLQAFVRKYKCYMYSTHAGSGWDLTSDENVVDDDKQRENVNGVLCKSPESIKDNKNIQNNAEKSSISIVGKK